MSNNANTPAPWTPTDNDHLVFKWVKLQGKSQTWVASALKLSQPTVSRIIQRYERWQAHAKDREDGRLDHAERLRAQRWLTFETNQVILASCLRIAEEMEGFIDSSKSTISRNPQKYSQENEIRTQHFTIDRTGAVARFLRLAFRINMEQLKLAALDPAPPPQPLSADELAEQAREAALAAAEFAAARRQPSQSSDDAVAWAVPTSSSDPPASASPPSDRGRESIAETAPPSECATSQSTPDPLIAPIPQTASHADLFRQSLPPNSSLNEPRLLNPAIHAVNNLNNADSPQIAATASQACTCELNNPDKKNAACTCIADQLHSPLPFSRYNSFPDHPPTWEPGPQTLATTSKPNPTPELDIATPLQSH